MMLTSRWFILAAACACLGVAFPARGQCGPRLDSALTLPGSALTDLRCADCDHDGIVDLCTLSGSSFQFQHGLGDGTFTTLFTANVGASLGMALGDFNTDGHMDVAFLSSTTVTIYHGNGMGSFTPRAPLTFGAVGGIALCAVDAEGDGKTDLIVLCGANGRNLSKLRNMGAGAFAAPVVSPLLEADASCMAAADLDGNGAAEVVVGSPSAGSIGIYAESNGVLQQAAQFNMLPGVCAVVLTDTNADGVVDICIASSTSNYVQLLARYSNLSFTNGSTATQFAITGLQRLAVGDINGDHLADLIGASTGGIAICVNAGAGFFYGAQQFTGFSAATIAAPDLLGDGSPDILVGVAGSPAYLLEWLSHVVTLPVITVQPQALDVQNGDSATFAVQAHGGSALTYQWYRGGTPLTNGNGVSGADGPALSMNSVSFADHLSTYTVRITNTCGTTTSLAAALGVHDCPGDFNHDGWVDFFDYLDFVGAFSVGC